MSGKRENGAAGKEEEEAASYIPSEVCEEILSRLPSNDLINFKLVCKDWLRLISSEGFIQKHLERSEADCDNLRIVVKYGSTTEIIDCANNTSKKFPLGNTNTDIIGSCNGLVLYYDRQGCRFAALNPCTGQIIPDPSGMHLGAFNLSWFGQHPSTGEYVFVVAYLGIESIEFQVYSLSLARARNNINSVPLSSSTWKLSNTWKQEICFQKIGILLHGRPHWSLRVYDLSTNYEGTVILAYDFQTNKITRMSWPVKYCNYPQKLGVVDGCLCAIQGKQVWMMKEYGVEESWTQYARIEGARLRRPLAFFPNGDLIISERYSSNFSYNDHSMLSKYSFKERESKILMKDCKTNYIITHCIACIDSLVSPTLLFKQVE